MNYKLLIFCIPVIFACNRKSTSQNSGASLPVEETDLFYIGMNDVKSFRIPALVVTNKGTLLAVSDARLPGPQDLPNNIDCVMRRSTDNGKTWSPMKTIVDFPGMEGAGDPSMLVDRQTGAIWLFVNYAKEGVGWRSGKTGFGDSTLHVLALSSADDGITWSAPADITRSIKQEDWGCVISSPGHGIQLKDGTLLQTAYFKHDNQSSSYFYFSKDHGVTWQHSNPVPGKTGESMALQLANGSVMMNMRNRIAKFRVVSYSSDMGVSWTPVVPDTLLPDPICQASIFRMKNFMQGGDKAPVLFSNPADNKKRRNLTLRMSEDEGKTWKYTKTLWAQDAGYSDITLLHNGSIGILYEKGSDGKRYKSICFASVPVSWLKK